MKLTKEKKIINWFILGMLIVILFSTFYTFFLNLYKVFTLQ